MSIGFEVALRAVPFFELLDREEKALAARILEAGEGSPATAAMEVSRRRLAQGVDAFVNALPSVIRNDANIAREAAYALVGLTDERMLHHPAGGLDRWRERLLEFELYGSALAGEEIVRRARSSSHVLGRAHSSVEGKDSSLLAPLYLGVLRAGFEGALRGDTLGRSSLVAALEEAVGTDRGGPVEIVTDVRPTRVGLSPFPMALLGLALWLGSGLAVWTMLSRDSLSDAERIEERVRAGLPAEPGVWDPFERSVGPSGLPPLDREPLRRSSDPHFIRIPPPAGN